LRLTETCLDSARHLAQACSSSFQGYKLSGRLGALEVYENNNKSWSK